MTETRELKKIDDNSFELIVKNEEHKATQIKGYTREELRGIFEEIEAQRKNLNVSLKQINKQLEGLDVEDTEELRALESQLHKIQQLQQKRQLEGKRDQQLKQLDTLADQMKEISVKVPEVLRNAEKQN
jgi:DNA-binding transcriptional MerR regulator